MQAQERRTAHRHPLSSKGYMVMNGMDLDLETHNISSGGLLVEVAAPSPILSGTRLHIHLDIGQVKTATVCRSYKEEKRTLVALEFESSLPESLTLH